jgi:hypothetical protein
MSNVPGIINLTSSVLRKLASYPVRSLIFIAKINLQLALNDYVTQIMIVDLSIFRTRFSSAEGVRTTEYEHRSSCVKREFSNMQITEWEWVAAKVTKCNQKSYTY